MELQKVHFFVFGFFSSSSKVCKIYLWYFHLWVICSLLLLVQFIRSVVSNSFWPHGLQHARLPCPPLSARVCSNSCPLSWWWYLTISSFAAPFSFLPSIFPSIRVFSSESAVHIRWPKYWRFSFSISPSMNIHGWFPLGLTGLFCLPSKGLSRVFSNTTIRKHQFFSTQLSL